jgi:thiamine pyrophosphate-dependent acetolactate synthase large subunit-like protein
MLSKQDFMEPLLRLRSDAVVVTTMGIVRPWGRRAHHELDFASADSAMGHAADLALGIALAQPERKVVCLNGDGSMLMALGTLVTAVEANPRNYFLFVLRNGTYEITGNQQIPGAGRIDFARLAEGAGFERVYSFEDAATYARLLPQVLGDEGPVFVTVRIEPGSEGPISRSEAEDSLYLRPSIAESAHRLRYALLNPRGL